MQINKQNRFHLSLEINIISITQYNKKNILNNNKHLNYKNSHHYYYNKLFLDRLKIVRRKKELEKKKNKINKNDIFKYLNIFL